MAKKFLDESGVTQVWSRVKEEDQKVMVVAQEASATATEAKENVDEALNLAKEANELATSVSGNATEALSAAKEAQATANQVSEEFEEIQTDMSSLRNTVSSYNDAIQSIQTTTTNLNTKVATLEADAEVEGSVDYKIAAAKEEIDEQLATKATFVEIDGLNTSISNINSSITEINDSISVLEASNEVEGSVDYKISKALEGLDAPDITRLQQQINTNSENISDSLTQIGDLRKEINKLEGSSEIEGSIKYEVAQGIAEVVASAPEDLDTLKEIADYITSDKTGAAELETKISELIEKDAEHDSKINSLVSKTESHNISIDSHTSSIASLNDKVGTLNGGADTRGSVDYKVATAVGALVDDANDDYNTLGKIEDQVKNVNNSYASLATAVNEEIARAKAAEEALGDRIDDILNEEVDFSGIQSQLDAHQLSIDTNTTNIATLNTKVDTLNGDVDKEGSVKYITAGMLDGLVGTATEGYDTLGGLQNQIINGLEVVSGQVNTETNRAKGVENQLDERITDLENSEANGLKGVTGAGFINASTTEGTAALTLTTATLENATETGDGLATAYDTKTYIHQQLDEFENDLNPIQSVEGVGYLNAKTEAGAVTLNLTTVTMDKASDSVDGLATALDTKNYVNTQISSAVADNIKSVNGAEYVNATVDAGKVTVSATTMPLENATDEVDGLATALDTRTYVDTNVEATNTRVSSLETFMNSAISNEEIDQLSGGA